MEQTDSHTKPSVKKQIEDIKTQQKKKSRPDPERTPVRQLSLIHIQMCIRDRLRDTVNGIAEAKAKDAERFTVKQMERTRKSIQVKLDKLNKQDRKDDVVTFEELGVDRMFVDEAHNYKNLFLVTKMRNVGGIAQTCLLYTSHLTIYQLGAANR